MQNYFGLIGCEEYKLIRNCKGEIRAETCNCDLIGCFCCAKSCNCYLIGYSRSANVVIVRD